MEKLSIQHNHELLTDLQHWVVEKFGHHSTFDQYRDAFNDHFSCFQYDNQKKLDVESLDSGAVSCSAAALITGFWGMHHNLEIPIFLISLDESGLVRKDQQHVLVAFPLIKLLSDHDFKDLLYNPKKVFSRLVADFVYTDTKEKAHKNGLRETPLYRLPDRYRKIVGVEDYYQDRKRILKLKSVNPSSPVESFSSPSTH